MMKMAQHLQHDHKGWIVGDPGAKLGWITPEPDSDGGYELQVNRAESKNRWL